jgi:serine phosphatase RsbU (regulator of sigma subunit)/Tfp pilus assembly protein PilF
VNVKFYIFSIFIIISSIANCNTDSLSSFIQNSNNVHLKFEAINKLISLELNSSPKKAQEYANLQLDIVKVDSQIARSYLNIGLALDYQSKFDSAIIFYNKSLSINKVLENEFWQAQALLNLGIVNYYKGDLEESVKYYFKALKLFENQNDRGRMSAIYNNLGNLYKSKSQYYKAIEFHTKSLHIDIENNDSSGVSGSYNNLGIVYRNLNKLDSSLYYYEKSLEIKRNMKDVQGVATSLTNLGQLYYYKLDFKQGLKYNIEALAIERKLENKRGICQSYINIGEGYIKTGDLNSASYYLERGYAMAIEIGVLEDLISAIEGLAEVSFQKGDYKLAYEHYQQYSLYKDSLLNKENSAQMAELDAIYGNESKQKEIILLNKEKILQQTDIENQRLQKIVMGIALFSLLIILFFIFRSFQQKKKINNILEEKNQLVEEKNKEITDSINYAQRIQKAVLQSEDKELTNFPDHFVLFKPKDIVSGDFYWMLEKNDSIYITAADCTGHGVPGGFMSMLGIAFLNEITAQKEILQPAEILNQLRAKIIKELGQKGIVGESRDGMDMSIIKINLKERIIEWAGANNPLLLISSNTELIKTIENPIGIVDSEYHLCELKPNKQPIGYANNLEPFKNYSAKLNKDDMMYLFTDGYVDQFGGEKGKKFMKKRFKNLLIKNANLSMEEQKGKLDENFNKWMGSLEQLDDVCVIGIKI